VARLAVFCPAQAGAARHGPMWLPHTDWLHHRLAITGPSNPLAAFRAAAAGAGIIPWHLDLDRLEEDLFHRLVSPPALPGSLTLPGSRTLAQDRSGVAGARVLAGQLRAAVAGRHERAVAHVGRSRACPLDLHALLPVPDAVLRLGPDEPAALAWLWQHWGTTQALRQVAEDVAAAGGSRRCPSARQAVVHLTFWSADWTPWRALAQLGPWQGFAPGVHTARSKRLTSLHSVQTYSASGQSTRKTSDNLAVAGQPIREGSKRKETRSGYQHEVVPRPASSLIRRCMRIWRRSSP